MGKVIKRVVINGFPRSGKDTFVQFCNDVTPSNILIPMISSVASVKQAALLLGWDGEKDAKGRNFLSNLKDMSTDNYDGPMKSMIRMLEHFKERSDVIGFFAIREPAEIAKFKLQFPKCVTVFIVRPGKDDSLPGNHADNNVQDYDYDYVVDNNGSLENLMNEAKIFISHFVETK